MQSVLENKPVNGKPVTRRNDPQSRLAFWTESGNLAGKSSNLGNQKSYVKAVKSMLEKSNSWYMLKDSKMKTEASLVIEKCLVRLIGGCKVLLSPKRGNNLKEFIESEGGSEASFSSEKSYEHFSPALDPGKCISPSEAELSNNNGSEQPANEISGSWNRISVRELGSCDLRDCNDSLHTQKRGLSSVDVYTLVALDRENRSGIGECEYGAEVCQQGRLYIESSSAFGLNNPAQQHTNRDGPAKTSSGQNKELRNPGPTHYLDLPKNGTPYKQQNQISKRTKAAEVN
ncbi:hypothetical protein Ancab_032261 [Ancistrocladus abbreviatus]